jgi:hypothetical protein
MVVKIAEKLGLVFQNPVDWSATKSMAEKLNACECPICKEAFRLETQILLPCGHVYHESCFMSFEKFMTSETCPLCRSPYDEKLRTFQGRKKYYIKSVIKIQSVWRMFQCRKAYLKYRETHIPKEKILKKRFCLDQVLQEINDRLTSQRPNCQCLLRAHSEILMIT